MIELILLGISLFAATVVIIEVIMLTLEILAEWWNSLTDRDIDDIGFTVADAVNDPNTPIIQGVFNKRTETVREMRKIKADQVDPEVASNHRRSKVVVFN